MRRFFKYSVYVFAALVAFIVATNVIFYVTTKPYVYSSADEARSAQVALILGAAVTGGQPSPVFADRLNTAIALYEAGKVQKMLVSGDNSALNHNEVNAAHRYLVGRGIPEQDIFLDHAGFDTYSSLYRARDVFGVTSMLITTQSFHLPRALFIAHRLGIQAYGVNADEGPVLFHNYLREIFSDEKAVLDLVFRVKPKYLGDSIPIEGDGRLYP